MKEIVDAFFKTESIVNHQIESYNYFVATKENTNNIMQQIVDETKVSDDEEPGVMVLHRGRGIIPERETAQLPVMEPVSVSVAVTVAEAAE